MADPRIDQPVISRHWCPVAWRSRESASSQIAPQYAARTTALIASPAMNTTTALVVHTRSLRGSKSSWLLIAAVLGNAAERWLLPSNFIAVVQNGYEYFSGDGGQSCVQNTSGEMECTGMSTLTLVDGATYLSVLLVVAVVLSLWSFRRRDVP